MPNWCYTNIIINHDDESKLRIFDKLLDFWTNRNYMTNGFGHEWLGNIVLGSGIGTVDTNSETDLRCRGRMTHKDIYYNELTIQTETAWAPMLKMWSLLVEKYLPNAKIIYNAEEPGMGIYATNDEDLKGKYVLDSWDENIEPDYEIEEGKLIEILQGIIHTKEIDVNKLIQLSNDEDYKFNIYKWKFLDINEWE